MTSSYRWLAAGAAAAAAAVICFALLAASSGPGSGAAVVFRGGHLSAAKSGVLLTGPSRGSLAGCEQRLERARRSDRTPVLAVIGASFTAGVGPGYADQSWAVLLARMLHWDAVVYGIPGAGYVHAGAGRRGPVARELAQVGLHALAPTLVVVQAGHDDIGVPPGLERRRVEQAVALIRAEVPGARIALVTVFTGRSSAPAAYRRARSADHAIVLGGTAGDRQVIIIDPLTAGWKFPRTRGGLHPTARGSEWIARTVAGILRAHGVRAAPAARPAPRRGGSGGSRSASAPVLCDSGIPAPAQPR
jgi:acyl-CoA thioesterase I